MGIRFYCPNGHKLNVKNYLAGKRGICPHCGAKVQIPLESTRLSAKEAARQKQLEQEAGVSASPNEAEEDVIRLTEDDVAADEQKEQVLSPASPAEEAVACPITEAPNAVWYVRPPTGGQFGPAVGEVMRAWVAEGRVSPDSLVWREGWPDWLPADQVFPKLGEMLGLPGQDSSQSNQQPEASQPAGPSPSITPSATSSATQLTGDAVVQMLPDSDTGAAERHNVLDDDDMATGNDLPASSRKPHRRATARESKNMTLVIVILLIIAVVVLGGLLAWVLIHRGGDTVEPQATEAVLYQAVSGLLPIV